MRGKSYTPAEREMMREILMHRDRVLLLMDTLRSNGRNTNSICQAIWKLERKDTARPTGERRTTCRIR